MPKLVIRMPVPSLEAPTLTPTEPFPSIPKIRFNTGSSYSIPKITIPSRALTPRDNSPDLDYAYVEPLEEEHHYQIKLKIKDPSKSRHKLKVPDDGMSMQDLKACQSVLKKLFASKISLLFRNPVGEFAFLFLWCSSILTTFVRSDPVKSGAPG